MPSVSWISPAGALLDLLQDLEDLRLQDVAAGDDQVGRRRSLLRLLDHAGDLERMAVVRADRDDAVLMRLRAAGTSSTAMTLPPC